MNPSPLESPGIAACGDAPVPSPDRMAGPMASLEALAMELEGQPQALLDLLRRLEALHRTIQDGPFRRSLPSDRHELFRLLEEMERSGGWPYIPRLQLRTFMALMPPQEGLPPPAPEADSPLAA